MELAWLKWSEFMTLEKRFTRYILGGKLFSSIHPNKKYQYLNNK